MAMVDLSVVIPAYNESRRIEKTLARIRAWLSERGVSYELIVVDDGSVDGTIALIEKLSAQISELKLLKLSHQGKGGAVRSGVLASNGELVLMSDADLSTPIEEFEKLKIAIDSGHDLAVGSRRAAGATLKRHQPWLRQSVGLMFGFFTQRIVPTGISDTQCGFKLFPKAAARRLFTLQESRGFCFDIEILGLARMMGLKIAEVPVVWEDAEGSKVKPLRHLPEVIREVVKIRLSLWRKGKVKLDR
jgi:dolichyl-phosphate beta-glucosyltransferase